MQQLIDKRYVLRAPDREMSDPFTSQAQQAKTLAVIPLIFAVVFAVPGIGGLLTLALIFVSWSISGFQFPLEDLHFMIIFGILSMTFIVGSALIVGIMLRYANWSKAPALSLGLSLAVLVSVLVSIAVFQSTFAPTDLASWYLLILAGSAGLAAGALPPFLHWRKERRLGT